MNANGRSGPRVAALVGPHTSGKTALLEALLQGCGAAARKPGNGTRPMTLEPGFAACRYLDEPWTLVDCPGSVELAHEAEAALIAADIAVVVAEPVPERAVTLTPLLKFLEARDIPHLVFVNKMDKATARMRDVLGALQQVSAKPLVLREVPIREGEAVSGYVDLVSGRAYRYRENQPSNLIAVPDQVRDRESESRQALLETLADFDDAMLEQLLEDRVPAPAEIYQQLRRDLQEDLIVPVFFGSAEHGNGVARLWKALRHEAPGVERTAARNGAAGEGFAALVVKTLHQPHTGKLSIARVLAGRASEGMALEGRKLAGLHRPNGGELPRVAEAEAGEIAAFGRLDEAATGDVLTAEGRRPAPDWPEAAEPACARALGVADRKDDVKLTAALAKLLEEDRGLELDHRPGGQMLLRGQGDTHLQLAAERLRARFNVTVSLAPPQTSYLETIRRSTRQHSRFKRQSGGHGQFADVQLEVAPQPRGAGYAFHNRVVGGAVPRNFIPAVDEGAQEALRRGPLGFPVVDVSVALVDGQFHSVDSSDQAFRTVASMAVSEALAQCEPVLLEPVRLVTIAVPNAFTARVHALVSGRRGQILGLAARDGWGGWDEVVCYLPEAETHDLATELRSATLGMGRFTARFDHLQELTGKLAERVVEDRRRAA